MPQNLRSSSSTSLGQRRSADNPVVASTASATAIPAISDNTSASAGANCGRRITEQYMPSDGADSHVLLPRPRPAVCSSAKKTLPSGSPLAAASMAAVLVDARSKDCPFHQRADDVG